MDTTQRYLSSSHEKEHDGIQLLHIGVTTAQLSPLLKHCKFSNKTHFYTKFYNALY